MKILVIFTGGTIGSAVVDGWISLDDNSKYALIQNFKKNDTDDVVFETLSPYDILSENLSGKELSDICNIVALKETEGYDGIIVTHGTDTLQYTASALAYCVKGQIPILLVSANYTLENPNGNGNQNFKSAVAFIKNKMGKGVFVAYKNTLDEHTTIHIATRIIGHQEGKDEVYSLSEPYACVTSKKVELLGEKECFGGSIGGVGFVEDPRVLVINSVPGEQFLYDVTKYRAVLIKPYHSGTLNTQNKNLVRFCKQASESNVPVFLANFKAGENYESCKKYQELGFSVLPYCAMPSIYVKIWLAISLNKDIKEFVLTELAKEFID